ncbi:hypothetical protein [Variovorax paradoxus]|uniref:hypothetical protein n=1 Tax=Variovorax paradoxus TaxID=34073 RepID=UPI0012DA98DA|nr:hypothetical protein [Variovorax paradoxus]
MIKKISTEADDVHAVDFFQWLKSLEKTLCAPVATHADGLEPTCAELAKRMPRASHRAADPVDQPVVQEAAKISKP